MSNCKSCGAEITWIKTMNGKNMPCDAKGITVVLSDGQIVTGYIPHWASCPSADCFRKKGKEE